MSVKYRNEKLCPFPVSGGSADISSIVCHHGSRMKVFLYLLLLFYI